MRMTVHLHWLGWWLDVMVCMHRVKPAEPGSPNKWSTQRIYSFYSLSSTINNNRESQKTHKHKPKKNSAKRKNGRKSMGDWAMRAQWITLITMFLIIALSTLWLSTFSRERRRCKIWTAAVFRSLITLVSLEIAVETSTRYHPSSDIGWRFTVHTFCQRTILLDI